MSSEYDFVRYVFDDIGIEEFIQKHHSSLDKNRKEALREYLFDRKRTIRHKIRTGDNDE